MIIPLVLCALLVEVMCQLPASELAYPPAQPLVVYMSLPDPNVYDYGPNHLPMPYAQAHMAPYCAYGLDMYGNCRQKEEQKSECMYGTTRSGHCRREPQKFCQFGEDIHGNCYQQAIHCRFGYDQFGDCIKAPYIPPVMHV